MKPDAMNELGTPEATDIYGKWVDYTIRFDCFAPSWEESQILALEFEDLLDACTGYITSKGAVKFWQDGRNADIYHMKTAYFYEPLMYMARIEKQKEVTTETFQSFYQMLDDRLMGTLNGH